MTMFLQIKVGKTRTNVKTGEYVLLVITVLKLCESCHEHEHVVHFSFGQLFHQSRDKFETINWLIV